MPHIGPYFMHKPGFKQIGAWGWDNIRLHSKIDKTPDENGCLNWQGAMSPTGALMGAWKSKDGVMTQQMTQVRRLIMMDVTNEDHSEYQIKLSCGNQRCCNHKEHFELKPTNRPKSQKSKTTKKAKTPDWWTV
jgi:hypothetical protein